MCYTYVIYNSYDLCSSNTYVCTYIYIYDANKNSQRCFFLFAPVC